jgi:hypothetical protein
VTPLIVWVLIGAGAWFLVSLALAWLWVHDTTRHRDGPSPFATPGYRGGLRSRLIGQNVEGP